MTDLRLLERPDGSRIAYRRYAPGAGDRLGDRVTLPAVLLLHATLSSGDQLGGLARLLAERTIVLVPDRRGSARSRIEPPRPVPLATQVDDCVAVLDAEAIDRAVVVGHSFGGVVGLALATTAPERVAALVAYEPPVLQLLDRDQAGPVADIPAIVAAAAARSGAAGAAEAFLRIVNGDPAFEALPTRRRAALLAEGGGVIADTGPAGHELLDPRRLRVPVTLVTGGASEPFYAEIIDRLEPLIADVRVVRLVGRPHVLPITEPEALAPIVAAVLSGAASPEEVA